MHSAKERQTNDQCWLENCDNRNQGLEQKCKMLYQLICYAYCSSYSKNVKRVVKGSFIHSHFYRRLESTSKPQSQISLVLPVAAADHRSMETCIGLDQCSSQGQGQGPV